MLCSSKWYILTKLNRVIFTVTLVALCLLVLGFSTPFWILISVKFNNGSRRIDRDVNFLFELPETDCVGLWQWCLKQYGCFDLSLLAKVYSTYINTIKAVDRLRENRPIFKINRIISMLTYKQIDVYIFFNYCQVLLQTLY